MVTKKTPSSKGSAKKRKNKAEDIDQAELTNEVLVSMVVLEDPPKEVQFTDTSYTSASFESVPPVPEVPKKKRRGRGVKDQSSKPVLSTTSAPVFDSLISVVEVEQQVDQDVGNKKRGKKKKKKEPKEEEVIPDFPKPKGWKKMNRKQRKDWKEQMIVEWQQQQEEEKQAYLAGAKERKERFERERIERAAMDVEDQKIREDLLRRTVMLFQEYEKTKADRDAAKIEMDKWQQYLKCDGLPDPRIVPQLSTYLQIWRSNANACDIDCLIQRSNEVLPMLELLDQLVTYTDQYAPQQLANLNEVRLSLQHELGYALDTATYSLLRDVEKQLVRVGLQLATYYRQLRGLHVALWLNVRMPIAKIRPNAPPPEPTQLEFPEMHVSVRLPASVALHCALVRAARQDYDVLSEHCRTFRLGKPFNDMRLDLYTFTARELSETERVRLEQDVVRRNFYKKVKDRIKELELFIQENKFLKNKNELEELERLAVAEPEPVSSPRDLISDRQAIQYTSYLKSVTYHVRSSELNLRQYRICGGVLRLDLLEQPPQPKHMRGELTLAVLQSPQGLRWLPFEVSIVVPPPPAPGQTRLPEEIEAEMKLLEAEYEKLALVHIDLPETVLWLEPPVVCHWMKEKSFWTTAHVHDSKYNEDKFTITFRTGVLWPMGLAVLKYTNLPYQGWELKPNTNGKGVLVTISGVIMVSEFLVVKGHVSLVSLQNGATSALQDIIGKKFPLQRLIKIMQDGGCDLFPDFDAHILIEGSCEKEWPMERHHYHAMAFLSTAYNFQWSRWNATANRRTIVMQMREAIDKKRTATLQLLHVTPLNVNVVKGSEVGPELDLEPIMGMKFYPDLFNLNLGYGSSAARRAALTMDSILAESVFELLLALKICSFS